MTAVYKGLLLAAIQVVVVLSLGAKLLYDRQTRPRAWVQTEVYDPELPVRGRYVSERLRIPAQGFDYTESPRPNTSAWYLNRRWAYLTIRDGQLIAEAQGKESGVWIYLQKEKDGTLTGVTDEPVLLFISDAAKVPIVKVDQQIWVEVTIPKHGPPRPIQLGLKSDGVLTPLNLN